ncbi:MAG: PepSY-associated TM helix domain-containing protein [Breznakibacter sp.]
MNIVKLYKKLHRWPGLIISFVMLYFAVTGIVMNHRGTFSSFDIDRKYLPSDYKYVNWNNSAVKGSLIVGTDSILVYGNIGIWLCDSALTHHLDFNAGFPKGIDNRKIFDVHLSPDGNLYAATLLGLYAYDRQGSQWKKFSIDVDIERFVGLESVGDTLFALNRSYLFKGISAGTHTTFERIPLSAPLGHSPKVSLFETMWQLHSGEIFGLPGKLVVDLLGFVTIVLSVTGIIYFFFPGIIKRRQKQNLPVARWAAVNRWSLKWHNRTGAWFVFFLVVLYFTGMFLRPPLLIPIAGIHVKPLKYSHLDQPNPWYDKLRDIVYDPERGLLLLSTTEGMYFMDHSHSVPVRFQHQPPVSVMGINVFEPYGGGAYLIGSFSGIFLWHPDCPDIYNYATGKPYMDARSGRPVGDLKVSGLMTDMQGNRYATDHSLGALALRHNHPIPPMPQTIADASGMSLWNLMLEIHTGRFFNFIFGVFYILIVPLAGLAGVIVSISGYLLWRKMYRGKRQK